MQPTNVRKVDDTNISFVAPTINKMSRDVIKKNLAYAQSQVALYTALDAQAEALGVKTSADNLAAFQASKPVLNQSAPSSDNTNG